MWQRSRWCELGCMSPTSPRKPKSAARTGVLGHIRPVATMVEVARLADPAHLVEVEVEAYLGEAETSISPRWKTDSRDQAIAQLAMRLVIQRVTSARVEVDDDEVVGAIDRPGLVILAGVPMMISQRPLNGWPRRCGRFASCMASDRVRKTRRSCWSASSRSTPTSARAAALRGARRHRGR